MDSWHYPNHLFAFSLPPSPQACGEKTLADGTFEQQARHAAVGQDVGVQLGGDQRGDAQQVRVTLREILPQ